MPLEPPVQTRNSGTDVLEPFILLCVSLAFFCLTNATVPSPSSPALYNCHGARRLNHSGQYHMKSTLALFSSARRNGNSGRLMDRIVGELNLEVVDLAQKSVAPYTYDHLHRGDDFEPLMTRLLTFDQLIFTSPVYWYSVSPAMKIFLDRISDYLEVPGLLDQGRRLRGKTGFVLCTSIMEAPDAPFIDAFQQTFEYLGMRFGGYLHANCVDGYMAEKYAVDVAEFLVRVQSV